MVPLLVPLVELTVLFSPITVFSGQSSVTRGGALAFPRLAAPSDLRLDAPSDLRLRAPSGLRESGLAVRAGPGLWCGRAHAATLRRLRARRCARRRRPTNRRPRLRTARGRTRAGPPGLPGR